MNSSVKLNSERLCKLNTFIKKILKNDILKPRPRNIPTNIMQNVLRTLSSNFPKIVKILQKCPKNIFTMLSHNFPT